ncbi:Uncharacterised protein [BD1-7 clade bacterium]|uniref:Uncharacterized protein n=1 Tax=BD1-7 clade bacterium TaxID=2029982 RepID=A0A5S9MT56_9GAMM|nr:Uncharacterised protein [BD1-7 clade bacterium]
MTLRPANPQGKGQTPVIGAWQSAQPQTTMRKTPQHMVQQYYVSLLVLSAHFRFKPVKGNTYWLYLNNERWHLSLIAPTENPRLDHCLGRCELRNDMTWSLDIQPDALATPALKGALQRFHTDFFDWLDQDQAFDEQLPVYAEQLPFYARLAAAGLSKSVILSSDIKHLKSSSREWLAMLPQAPLLSVDSDSFIPFGD